MSARALKPSAQLLELFVLQHRGQEVNHSWSWPEDRSMGLDASSQVGFDTILDGVEGLDDATLQQAASCTLQRMGSPQQAVWVIGNGMGNSGHTLACSVSGSPLAAGNQLRLAHGDEIELGLTRLLVSLEPSQGMPDLPDCDLPVPGSLPSEQEGTQDMAGFALTDLDAVSGTDMLANAQQQGLKKLGFGDLISLNPEVTAVAQVPTPTLNPVKAVQAESLAVAEAVPEGSSYSEKVSSLLAQFRDSTDVADPGRAITVDPLGILHARYLDKLRNPSRADADDAWQDLVRGAQTHQTDPMQHWMQAAGSNPGLDDLLGQQHSIDSVIQGLDPLGSTDVLAPEPYDSVMHLFAPDNLRVPEQASLQSLVQHSLPGLTQREHHSMSLDSAMPFIGGEQPEPAP